MADSGIRGRYDNIACCPSLALCVLAHTAAILWANFGPVPKLGKGWLFIFASAFGLKRFMATPDPNSGFSVCRPSRFPFAAAQPEASDDENGCEPSANCKRTACRPSARRIPTPAGKPRAGHLDLRRGALRACRSNQAGLLPHRLAGVPVVTGRPPRPRIAYHCKAWCCSTHTH